MHMTLATYLNSQFSALQELDFFVRILLACVCGACIGVERSRRLKEAGIRTHVIVCCAAALMMIVSKYGFADLTSAAGAVFNGTRGADPARVAAQVVSGISFLGAGVIFKHGNTIKGLTTAAGIWATAGIGLAIGAGMFVVGIFTTVVVVVSQILTHRSGGKLDAAPTCRLQFTVSGSDAFPVPFSDLIAAHRIQLVSSTATREADGSLRYDVTIRAPQEETLHGIQCLLEAATVRSVVCQSGQ